MVIEQDDLRLICVCDMLKDDWDARNNNGVRKNSYHCDFVADAEQQSIFHNEKEVVHNLNFKNKFLREREIWLVMND
jgi:hypothetical protein